MANGWDWIEEGQRLAEEARRARELDIDAIKAGSIVFEGPLDALKAAGIVVGAVSSELGVGALAGSLADVVREVGLCRAGHCASGREAARLGDEVKRLRAALNEALTILGEV